MGIDYLDYFAAMHGDDGGGGDGDAVYKTQ
jgi:hypothetical protein